MRTRLRKLQQQVDRVFGAVALPENPAWHQPGTYSVWAYDMPDCEEPVVIVLKEWAIGGLRSICLEGVWLHENDTSQAKDVDFWKTRGDWDNQDTLADLIASGRLHRIGPMPPIKRYGENRSD
jgi:hypothetical protein